MLAPGSSVGTYKILSRIGSGVASEIFEAEDERLGRKVALRVLSQRASSDPKTIARFKTAAKQLAGISHGGIVPILQIDEAAGHAFCVMPHLAGGNLRHYLSEKRPADQIVEIIATIAEALSFAHSQGLIHRDLKPENIMMSDKGDPMIGDFGLSRALRRDPDASATAVMESDPRYTSPEEARGQPLDERTDIYSLGVIMFEALTGAPPYEAPEPLALMFKHVSEPIPTLPAEFAALQLLLDQMMAKDSSDRFATAVELVDALSNVRVGAGRSPGGAAPPTPRQLTGATKMVSDADLAPPPAPLPAPPPVPLQEVAPAPPGRSRTTTQQRKSMSELMAEARRKLETEVPAPSAGDRSKPRGARTEAPKVAVPKTRRATAAASSGSRLVPVLGLLTVLLLCSAGVYWYIANTNNKADVTEIPDGGAAALAAAAQPLSAQQRRARLDAETRRCTIHVSQLTENSEMLYEDVLGMDGAVPIEGTQAMRMPSMKTADGRDIRFDVTPDGCARVARSD